MKKSLIILCFISLGSLNSCSKFLEEKPQSFTNAETFYQTEAQAQSAVNACYLRLYNLFTSGLMCATEYTSDLAFLDAGSVDQTFGISPSNPGFGDDVWTGAYSGIMICNASIAGIQRSPIPEAKKPALLGEAVTLRAFYYYILTSMFGDVPYYTSDASASFDALMVVAAMGRMPAASTRDSLIADLQKWAPSLPQVKSATISDNRISGSMAWMLMAKLALWNRNWDVALDATQKLKAIYGSLAQYPLTDTWFRNKNKPESIFEIQYAYSATGIIRVSEVAPQLTPARASGSNVYDGVPIAELGSAATIYTAATPTSYFLSLYDTTDLRREMTLAYRYNGTWFNRPKANNFTGKPWPGPKFWCPGMNLINDGNNQKVFRYADALLVMAEAANEKGDNATALSAINEVKSRAGAKLVMAAHPGKEEFREELKKERAREMMGEYGRKWDLVRWGDFFNRVSATSALEVAAIRTNLKPYHEYYPIPEAEVQRSKGILTNTAYNK